MNDDQKQLIQLAHTKMPFGKYEGRYLIELPEYYLVWYQQKDFQKEPWVRKCNWCMSCG